MVTTLRRCVNNFSAHCTHGITRRTPRRNLAREKVKPKSLLGNHGWALPTNIWTAINTMKVPVRIDIPGIAPIGEMAMIAGSKRSGP